MSGLAEIVTKDGTDFEARSEGLERKRTILRDGATGMRRSTVTTHATLVIAKRDIDAGASTVKLSLSE
jgi:hypothetical protein